MKKEWMYFFAGAGLMAAAMTFNMKVDSSADCVAVAKHWETGEGYLNDHEMKVHASLGAVEGIKWKDYVSGYKACLEFEGK